MPVPSAFSRPDRAPSGPPARDPHAALQGLSLAFARCVASSSGLEPALQAFAREANALLGATRTAVWLYDRSARELVLTASSAPGTAGPPPRIRDDDAGAAARGRHLHAPDFVESEQGRVLVAPLRGWRRALGAFTIEGIASSALDEDQLRAVANELGKHLSGALENVQLVDEILRQRRLFEAEREALQLRLSQSEKLAALGQFVAGVAHEMNNPLQGLLGHLELLMSHSEAARPLRTELRRIYREGERAARIVRNLLVFTGTRRMARRRLRIERVLTRALASRRTALAKARIDVVRQFGRSVPAVVGDPLLLEQAFLNVLINAEHAIRERDTSGTIEVSTAVEPPGTVLATIRDTGPGIAPGILPKVFDPFFTTREAGRGTGLGLAVTYGILQEHGGTIQAGNWPGGGAVFTIALPGAPARDE